MREGAVPVKTDAGQAELGTRRLRLGQRHRTVLLLIDGRRTEAEVRHLASQAGVPASVFDELLGLALIALPVEAGRPQVASPVEPMELSRMSPRETVAAAGPRPETPVELPHGFVSTADSLLPAAGTLPPDSLALDDTRGGASPPDSWLPAEPGEDEAVDAAFDQARRLLVRAVRTEAPVTGSLTLLRLRRARSRADLDGLLGEVEARISRPHRSLAAMQLLTSVRQLLARHVDTQASPA